MLYLPKIVLLMSHISRISIQNHRQDFVDVTRMLEDMKTKFDQTVDRLTYSGIGKRAALLSVRDPPIQVPFTQAVFETELPPSPENPPMRKVAGRRSCTNVAKRVRRSLIRADHSGPFR